MVAAWETRLLLSWLYVSPENNRRDVSEPPSTRGNLTRRTPDGIPHEYGAGFEPAADLINPLVIEGHPNGSRFGRDIAGLDSVPEVRRGEVLVRANRVEAPSALGGESEDLEE